MPTILKCPRCEALVRVFDGVGVNSLVCCPACREEFLLGEFLAAEIPELVVVKAVPDPGQDPSQDLEQQKDDSGLSAFAFSIAEETPDKPVGIWGQGESPSDDEEIDTEADSVEDIPVPAETELNQFNVQGTTRRRKETNVGAFLLLNVLGGVFGLLVAYYGLSWAGYAGGLPKLPLPFLPHTMHWNDAVAEWVRERASASADDSNSVEKDSTTVEEENQPAGNSDTAPPSPPQRKTRELAAGDIGPKEPTEYYTLSELDERLKEAETALEKDRGFSRVSFRKFCRLGELLPFTEASAELAQRTDQIRSMLRHYGTGEKNENTVDRLANIVLSYPNWPEPGILVLGEVRATSKKNGLHETLLWLPSYKKTVPVLSNRKLALKKGDRVLVLGSVIRNPSENILGYDGKAPFVIWNGLSMSE